MAFVEFIKNNRADPFQQRVILQHAGEDAFRDDLDTRLCRHLVFKPNAVANGLANLFTQLLGHEYGSAARSHPARFQHHDFLAVQPIGIHQCQRHLGSLARPGRGFQHQAWMQRERCADVCQQRRDGK